MIQIERILCPTDFSAESDAALQYAFALARTYEAKLYICHCVESPILADIPAIELFSPSFETGIETFSGGAQSLSIPIETFVIKGDPVVEISKTAAEHHIDLIVMRSRRRPVAATLLGSTAEAICRTAPCPVLVTHSQEHEWPGISTGKISLSKILVAHDFSNDSELSLKYGISLAQEHQAELHLIHVLPFSPAPALAELPPSLERDFERAARMLKESVPDEIALWCKVSHTITSGQPYREILNYAQNHEIDLICMGVHGAGFSMRALFGSNSDRVLRQAPCPILIARPLKPALSIAA